MLEVTVADSETCYVGIYKSDDRDTVIKRAIADLKENHNWTQELEFHEVAGPPWSNTQKACGLLARPEDFEEDPEWIINHEGTAWVYVEEPIFDTMVDRLG